MTDEIKHEEVERWKRPDKYLVKCACGEVWSQPANSTPEHLASIFASHVAYFNRPKTRVD